LSKDIVIGFKVALFYKHTTLNPYVQVLPSGSPKKFSSIPKFCVFNYGLL